MWDQAVWLSSTQTQLLVSHTGVSVSGLFLGDGWSCFWIPGLLILSVSLLCISFSYNIGGILLPTEVSKQDALVSQGYHSKVPQTVWLETIETYSLTVAKTRSGQSILDHILFKAQGKNPLLPLTGFLVVPSNPWHSLICGSIILISASIIIWLSSPWVSLCEKSLSPMRTLFIEFRVSSNLAWPHLNLTTSAKTVYR